MKILMEIETDVELGLDLEALAAQVGEQVLDQEECPYEASVNLLISDDAHIHEVNRQFREIDRATDVLSFPMVPFESPCDYDILEEDDTLFDPETGELLLGDIMISAEHVLAQAQEYGHSVKREFCFLVAHSMLHLLGYDHMTDEEAKEMFARQEMALDTLGIHR